MNSRVRAIGLLCLHRRVAYSRRWHSGTTQVPALSRGTVKEPAPWIDWKRKEAGEVGRQGDVVLKVVGATGGGSDAAAVPAVATVGVAAAGRVAAVAAVAGDVAGDVVAVIE